MKSFPKFIKNVTITAMKYSYILDIDERHGKGS